MWQGLSYKVLQFSDILLKCDSIAIIFPLFFGRKDIMTQFLMK